MVFGEIQILDFQILDFGFLWGGIAVGVGLFISGIFRPVSLGRWISFKMPFPFFHYAIFPFMGDLNLAIAESRWYKPFIKAIEPATIGVLAVFVQPIDAEGENHGIQHTSRNATNLAKADLPPRCPDINRHLSRAEPYF